MVEARIAGNPGVRTTALSNSLIAAENPAHPWLLTPTGCAVGRPGIMYQLAAEEPRGILSSTSPR